MDGLNVGAFSAVTCLKCKIERSTTKIATKFSIFFTLRPLKISLNLNKWRRIIYVFRKEILYVLVKLAWLIWTTVVQLKIHGNYMRTLKFKIPNKKEFSSREDRRMMMKMRWCWCTWENLFDTIQKNTEKIHRILIKRKCVVLWTQFAIILIWNSE